MRDFGKDSCSLHIASPAVASRSEWSSPLHPGLRAGACHEGGPGVHTGGNHALRVDRVGVGERIPVPDWILGTPPGRAGAFGPSAARRSAGYLIVTPIQSCRCRDSLRSPKPPTNWASLLVRSAPPLRNTASSLRWAVPHASMLTLYRS